MKVSELKKAVELCFDAKVVPNFVAQSGIGKTTVAKQIGKKLNFDRTIILRPSMLADVADLVGLPEISRNENNELRSSFAPPEWLPKKDEKVLIVIDEINRSRRDIVMALFDVIDFPHKLGQYTFPEGTQIITTMNPPTEDYSGVDDFTDVAFLSRLCSLKVDMSAKDFYNYMLKENNEDVMLSFYSKNESQYFKDCGKFSVDDMVTDIAQNNRLKEQSFNLYKSSKKLKISNKILKECFRGIGGLEFSNQVINHIVNYEKEIITLEKILTDSKSLNKFDFDDMPYVAKILSDLKKQVLEKNKYNKKEVLNLNTFLKKVPLDTLNGFFSDLADSPHLEFFNDLDDELIIKIYKIGDLQVNDSVEES